MILCQDQPKTNRNFVFVFSPEELPVHDAVIEKVSPLSSSFFLLVSKHCEMSWWSILVICISKEAHSKSPKNCHPWGHINSPRKSRGPLTLIFINESEYSWPIMWPGEGNGAPEELPPRVKAVVLCQELPWPVQGDGWCEQGGATDTTCALPSWGAWGALLLWEMVTNTLLPLQCGDLPCNADLLSWVYSRHAAPLGSCCGSWCKNPSAAGGFWRSILTTEALGMWKK